MHRVDRGPEPDGLQAVRDKRTPAWITHYRDNTGPKPSDSDWRKFADEWASGSHNSAVTARNLPKAKLITSDPRRPSPNPSTRGATGSMPVTPAITGRVRSGQRVVISILVRPPKRRDRSGSSRSTLSQDSSFPWLDWMLSKATGPGG